MHGVQITEKLRVIDILHRKIDLSTSTTLTTDLKTHKGEWKDGVVQVQGTEVENKVSSTTSSYITSFESQMNVVK